MLAPINLNKKIEEKIIKLKDGEVIAFVDGSYSDDVDGKEKYSFGAVIISEGKETNLYKAYIDKNYVKFGNVAGELMGVKEAILWSLKHNKKKITIFYDYAGIEKWARYEWKAKNALTQKYVQFIEEKKLLIDVDFYKVPSHTDVLYNEKADTLAKKSLASTELQNL